MKNIKFLIPILLLIFSSSCIDRTIHYEDFDACFQITDDMHYINEPVYFVNCSLNAEDYEWNFGDGTTSNLRNPDHIYTNSGTYQVTLKAYGYDNYSETYTHAITVQGSTDLDLLVMYYGTEDPISNCEINLFDNFEDWQTINLDNSIATLTTSTYGSVVFKGLQPIEYYIDAYREVDDTTFYSNETIGYMTDGALVENAINEYNIYVELLTTSNKKSRKKYSIKYIKKSSKEEHERIIKAFKAKQ